MFKFFAVSEERVSMTLLRKIFRKHRKDPQHTLYQVITLASAVQAGNDMFFVKMTLKIPKNESTDCA